MERNEYDFETELALDRIANARRIEYECYHEPKEEQHEYVGDCVFCKHPIYADDADYIINDKEQLGICVICMDKCHWRCD